MSMRDEEVTSPATITNPVLVSVSHATRDALSSLMRASRNRIRHLITQLVGVAFVTLSDVNKYSDIDDSLISNGFEAAEVSQRARRESMEERNGSLNFPAISADEAKVVAATGTQPCSPNASGATSF
jgi:hypothetical protein